MSDLKSYDPVVPSKADAQIAEQSGRVLAAYGHGDLRVHLDDGQTLVLPQSVARLLGHILTEMAEGNAVTMIPIHAEMTTQEAADFLNMSRPYLVGLLERGEMPFHKIGTHRRVKFTDVARYQAENRAARTAALDELARQSQNLGLGY